MLKYQVVNCWNRPRGTGYAVMVRDENGKSVTGNNAAFHSKSLTSKEADQWVYDQQQAEKFAPWQLPDSLQKALGMTYYKT